MIQRFFGDKIHPSFHYTDVPDERYRPYTTGLTRKPDTDALMDTVPDKSETKILAAIRV